VKKERTNIIQFPENRFPIEGIRLGRITSINESGVVLVDFPGNTLGPIAARTTTWSNAQIIRDASSEGREILLAFENNDAKHPILVDIMHSPMDHITEPASTVFEAEGPQDVTVDGKKIVFVAENEIVLKCGKANITLTKAGKVLIKGEYVLSHSSGDNRIKGGSISIN